MIVNSLVAGKTIPNGEKWTKCPGSPDKRCINIKHINGLFITGTNSNGGTWYSEDGMNWVKTNVPDSIYLNIRCINGKWIGVGSPLDDYIFYYSDDGKTWNTDNQAYYIEEIIYEAGLYVAWGGSDVLYYSDDCKTWTKATSALNVNPDSMIYVNGTFITYESSYRHTSSNGKTWSRASAPYKINYMKHVNGIIVAGTEDKGLIYSYDGLNWTQSNIKSGDFRSEIGYAEGLCYTPSTDDIIYTSKDGKTWTPVTLNFSYDYINNKIVYGNGTFFIYDFLKDSRYYIYRSTDDMETFRQIDVDDFAPINPSGIIHARGMWFAASDNGIYYSMSK